MTQQLAQRDSAEIMDRVVAVGDLSRLEPGERVQYYNEVCRSLGLNPLTRPFEYITLNGKLTLYARKDATDQLRTIHGVSVTKLERERLDDLYVVTAHALNKAGRADSAIGAVSVKGLTGEALANALMKAETKAKRRVTLSLCGLGWIDDAEVESIADARTIVVDQATGEIIEERAARVAANAAKHTQIFGKDEDNSTFADIPDIKVPMVESADHRLYQRYGELSELATSLGVKYEVLQLPISEADIKAKGKTLADAIDLARAAREEAAV